MCPHVPVERPQPRELLPFVARELAEERALPVHHLVVREREDEVLVPCVDERERQVVVVPAAVDRLARDVPERVVHPAQVPLEGESQPAGLGRARDAGPGGGLLGKHRDAGVRRVDDRVQLLQKLHGLEVLAPAVAVRHPFPRRARVVEVEHRGDAVDPQAVCVELLEPVERVRDEEVAHLVAAVVEDQRAPVGVRPAPGIRVLVQRRPVEPRQRPVVHRKMRGDPVQDHADSAPMQLVDERPQVVRLPESGVRGVEPGHLVAPRRAVGMLHHREELDVREPEPGHVLGELVGEVAPVEPLAPGAGVELVDRERRRQRVGRLAPLHPGGVRPCVTRPVDERGRARRHLGPERERVGLEPRHVVEAANRELVRVPLAGVRDEPGPDARRALRREQVGVLAPVVPVADHRHSARARRPDREAHTLVAVERMSAQLLPEPLVPALPDEVQVELAGDGHRAVSSMRRRPTTGIEAQSGRFRAS